MMSNICQRLESYMATAERVEIEREIARYRAALGAIPLCARCREEYLRASGGCVTFFQCPIEIVDTADCCLAERGIGDRVVPCA